MLGAQGIRATGFKRAQGNAHCAKFESHTNRVTFETNAIRMTSSVQAQYEYSCLLLFANAIIFFLCSRGGTYLCVHQVLEPRGHVLRCDALVIFALKCFS